MDEEEKRRAASANRQAMEARAKKMLKTYQEDVDRDKKLSSIAKSRGREIADWSEPTASDIAAKDRQALKGRTRGPGGHDYALMNEQETPVFEKRMGDEMSSSLEKRRRATGRPTGWDATMRKSK